MTYFALVLFVFEAISGFKAKLRFNRESRAAVLWLSLPIWFYLIVLFWTSNVSEGISFVVRSIPWLIIPLVLFVGKPFKKENEIEIFTRIYILASVAFSLISLIYIAIQVFNGEIVYNTSSYFSVMELRNTFDNVPVIHEHPIYGALIAGIALLFISIKGFNKQWINIVCSMILLIFVGISGSRGPILGLLAAYLVFIFGTFNFKKAFLLTLVLSLLLAGIIVVSPLKSRISEVFKTEKIYPEGLHFNSFNLRMGIYKCSWVLGKEVPIYGFGAGDVQYELNQCYASEFKTNAYKNAIYNTHNQFLFYWLAFGSIGFFLIILSYFKYLWRAKVFRNRRYMYFLIFFFVAFLFENILSRNTGILLFVMFNSLFYYQTYMKDDCS